MPDVAVTVRDINRTTGVNFTSLLTAAVAGNDYLISNDGNVRLLVQAAAGATVTVVTPNTEDGNAVADKTVTLTGTNLYVLGPFPPQFYNNAAGQLDVQVSAATSLLAVRG